MKIIKHGSTKQNEVLFECKKCGCQFEALEDERWEEPNLTYLSYPSKHWMYSCCPECKKICKTYITDRINEYDITLTTGCGKGYVFGCDGKGETVGRHTKGVINKP